jgi:hypothetical protein
MPLSAADCGAVSGFAMATTVFQMSLTVSRTDACAGPASMTAAMAAAHIVFLSPTIIPRPGFAVVLFAGVAACIGPGRVPVIPKPAQPRKNLSKSPDRHKDVTLPRNRCPDATITA